MRISILIISAASLVAFGGLAQADDHLFQAFEKGLDGNEQSQGGANSISPGRASPFTSFPDNTAEQGIPSTDQEQAHQGQDLPAKAGPKNRALAAL
jgi:hypothetical protein